MNNKAGWYANMMLEKLGRDGLRHHIAEMKFKMVLLSEGMKKITAESIVELEAVLN